MFRVSNDIELANASVQVFLVTAVFSGAATVASQLAKHLQDPTSIPELLARQLPKSSNFYLTYFIVQGTMSSADNLLNYSSLLLFLVSYNFVDKTPRQKFDRYTSMKGIAWGKVYPKVSSAVN
jgi:calcium permeable stress-gated cation channel